MPISLTIKNIGKKGDRATGRDKAESVFNYGIIGRHWAWASSGNHPSIMKQIKL
jgi:hypothetical protein